MPWLVGGDWNFERDQFRDWWDLGNAAQVIDTEWPTQMLGTSFDCNVGSFHFPVRTLDTVVSPGTDHVGATLTTCTAPTGTL